MKYVRLIDANGLFVEDAFVDELTVFTIETPCPDGYYLPKWDGEKWVEGGEAPATVTPELTLDEKVTQLAEQMVIAQRQLELSQEAIDFIIMGGM